MSSTFTTIPDTNLEPGKPIRSLDIIAIKDNTNYLKEYSEIEILDTQIFTASGTWTKPGNAGADDTLIVACIGGGGSGGAARSSFTGVSLAGAGGGGGGVGIISIKASELPSTVAVTVGGGGAARTAPGGNIGVIDGLAGGNSLFGSFLAAIGGGGGQGRAADNTSSNALGGSGGNYSSRFGNANIFTEAQRTGGDGRQAVSTTATTGIPSGLTGGGGADGHNHSPNQQQGQNRVASTGRFFGDGGAGANGAASGGSIPGGGGGGATSRSGATSGAGARGEVQCYLVRGRVAAEAFFNFTL